MASSSTHSFLLISPLLLLLSMTVVVVDSGSAPTAAPAATAEKYQKWCQFVASDSQSCIKVIESIPGIQDVDYKNAGKVADLCMHFAAKKTTEAKGAADTLLAAAKDKPSSCLKACATNIKSMGEVLVNLPAGQDDMKAYLTFKELRAKFKDQKPPACEKDCWNKTSSSSSADETAIVDKFHDIWNVAKVGNEQINYIFPWPDSEDDHNIL